MPWVELHEAMDYRIPGKRSMRYFKVGKHLMTTHQADEAKRLGKGDRTSKPKGNADGTGDTAE